MITLMAKILSITSGVYYGSYATISVVLDNGEEAEVYVGGEVECFYDNKNGVYKAFVKRRVSDVDKGTPLAPAIDDDKSQTGVRNDE